MQGIPPYRFSRRVDNYIKYRPRYPHATLDLLQAECQLTHRVALEDEDARLTAMLEELEAVFEAHQADGRVTIEQDLHVIYGQH